MREKKQVVSLIIPAYKQEHTIYHDLLRIKHVMDQLRYEYEIIVVVDGEIDRMLKK
jgi:glycosyltransferase involved in cell wall biosynthesis